MTINLRKFLFLVFFSFINITLSEAQSIKTAKGFVEYFKTIKNMVNYKKVKNNIENLRDSIKQNIKISDPDKNILKEYYGTVKGKSDSLFDKIVADLLDKKIRKTILNDTAAYIEKINEKFEDINTSYKELGSKYKEITGSSKGPIIPWLIKEFALPLAKEFLNEIINLVVKKYVKNNLKKLIVIKPWD